MNIPVPSPAAAANAPPSPVLVRDHAGAGNAGLDTPGAEPERAVQAALAALEQILAENPKLTELVQTLRGPADPRDQRTVREIVDLYIEGARDEISPDFYTWRINDLRRFAEAHGDRKVSDCGPLDLKRWVYAPESRAYSVWSRSRINTAVQRAFNYAVEMRLLRENPFKGCRLREEKPTGRDMKPAEFQALLRASDPYFRRFLMALRLTGARPSELRTLRWSDIDWERGIATLQQHKTRKKTGKPRVLVLLPQMLRLLLFIKRTRPGPAAYELRRILQSAPDRKVRAKAAATQMRALGYSYRMIYLARKKIGAMYRRIGGWREHGYTVYELPANAVEVQTPRNDPIFLCGKNRAWTRSAMVTKFRRLRIKLDLPKSCRMYGLRHFYITDAVRKGVNLKAIAILVGHVDTRMIDRVYCHLADDLDFLRQAAHLAVAPKAPIATSDDYPALTPTSGNGRDVQPPVVTPAAAPGPDLSAQLADLVKALMQQLDASNAGSRAAVKPTPPRSARKPGLTSSEEVAWSAYNWAIEENPKLAKATDATVYAWLRKHGQVEQLPPCVDTFRRYLSGARKHYLGCSRRQMRYRPASKADEAEPQGP